MGNGCSGRGTKGQVVGGICLARLKSAFTMGEADLAVPEGSQPSSKALPGRADKGEALPAAHLTWPALRLHARSAGAAVESSTGPVPGPMECRRILSQVRQPSAARQGLQGHLLPRRLRPSWVSLSPQHTWLLQDHR